LLDRIIHESRHSTAPTKDLLTALVQAHDETGHPLSNVQIRDQILTFLFAGHETTANTLSWTFYLLAQNPLAYERLQSELDAELQGELPTYESLRRLPYTMQVIQETLRLYPVAYAFGRTALKDIQLGDYQVRKGQIVLASPYILHRRPDYFPEPEQFNPDRFLPDAETTIPRSAYIPFGAGPRSCIGRQFALMEARLLLAVLAQKHRFTLLNESEIYPEPMITLRPSTSIQMAVDLMAQNRLPLTR
jgi:cytochrome P450